MIRAYKEEDKKELIDLLKLNVPTYFAEPEVDDFAEYLDKELDQYFVSEKDGKIIGCGGINFMQDNKTARVAWDIINPNFQRKGIGTQLLKYRIQKIKDESKIDNIQVRTSQHVYIFYEKQGFKLEKIEKDFWAKGFDLYQMNLKI